MCQDNWGFYGVGQTKKDEHLMYNSFQIELESKCVHGKGLEM